MQKTKQKNVQTTIQYNVSIKKNYAKIFLTDFFKN